MVAVTLQIYGCHCKKVKNVNGKINKWKVRKTALGY